MMNTIRESQIEQHLCKEIEKRGGITYKLSPLGRINKPDRLVLMPNGRAFFVETKAPGKLPRAAQIREHNRLRALGFEVYIIDSYDLTSLEYEICR